MRARLKMPLIIQMAPRAMEMICVEDSRRCREDAVAWPFRRAFRCTGFPRRDALMLFENKATAHRSTTPVASRYAAIRFVMRWPSPGAARHADFEAFSLAAFSLRGFRLLMMPKLPD